MATEQDKAIGAGNLRELAKEAERAAREYRAEALRIEREIIEARLPKMPEVTSQRPAIVAFTKYQSGREYHYAALGWRVLGGRSVRWAVTGQTTDRLNWPGLLAFIGEGNWSSLRVMIDGDSLVPEGTEPAVAEKMGAYGRVVSSEVLDTPFARGGLIQDRLSHIRDGY